MLADLPLDILVLISKLDSEVGRQLHLTVKRLFESTKDVNKQEWYRVNGDSVSYIRVGDELKLHSFNDEPFVLDQENKHELRRELNFNVDLGSLVWFQLGQTHRDRDLPAVISPDGSRIWYRNGQ